MIWALPPRRRAFADLKPTISPDRDAPCLRDAGSAIDQSWVSLARLSHSGHGSASDPLGIWGCVGRPNGIVAARRTACSLSAMILVVDGQAGGGPVVQAVGPHSWEWARAKISAAGQAEANDILIWRALSW